jgi:hypothetical protein
LDPSGEKARAETEVGYFGYAFIRFFDLWSQMEMKPSDPPEANVLWLGRGVAKGQRDGRGSGDQCDV